MMQIDNDKNQEVITTESSKFDEIRHYNDSEVPNAIQSILNDDELISGVSRYMFKKLPNFMVRILKPFVKHVLKKKFSKVKTIREVQEYVATFMKGIIRDTTDGFTYSGFDKLDKNTGYLFISNHRDISLDPAFIDMACFFNDLDTVKIAIGDNLLRKPVATDLMKLNKSFIVKRSLTSPKAKLKAFSELSEYIGLAIEEKHNVWIAHREGRAKDGNDLTEEAILKMFYMYGKKKGLSFSEYIKQLKIVPVSITYEYDPGDEAKARELYETEKNGTYTKSEFEDIDSIVGGIKGYKGRVHISAGKPLEAEYADASELAFEIDRYIHKHYRMFPSAIIAANQLDNSVSLDGITEVEKSKYLERLNSIPEELREIFNKYYATPYFNNKKVQNIEGKH
ncbi:MAG: 1-acyl-sn-glycerol-3-phosphate acyltransferase [Ruminobacter sp.]|nr:1-acyl-sn-glycerol-3-phosphate acyltransferase [Ruminobacter sp.]